MVKNNETEREQDFHIYLNCIIYSHFVYLYTHCIQCADSPPHANPLVANHPFITHPLERLNSDSFVSEQRELIGCNVAQNWKFRERLEISKGKHSHNTQSTGFSKINSSVCALCVPGRENVFFFARIHRDSYSSRPRHWKPHDFSGRPTPAKEGRHPPSYHVFENIAARATGHGTHTSIYMRSSRASSRHSPLLFVSFGPKSSRLKRTPCVSR